MFQTARCALILAATLQFVVFSILLPTAARAEEKPDLGPIALTMFHRCLDLAIEGRQLTTEEFYEDVGSTLQSYADQIAGSFSDDGSMELDLLADFECRIQVPIGNYDPVAFRTSLEHIYDYHFDGRADGCHRVFGVGGGRATVIKCYLSSASNPSNSFTVLAGLFPTHGALFWLHPVLIFDPDGKVRTIKPGVN